MAVHTVKATLLPYPSLLNVHKKAEGIAFCHLRKLINLS